MEEKQKWVIAKTAETEAEMKLQTAEDLNKLQAELLQMKKRSMEVEAQMEDAAVQSVLSLEYERDTLHVEIERLREENLELKNKQTLQAAERILQPFSTSSQLYEGFCIERGFDYSLRGIETQVGGKNLLHVGIIEARRNQNLLPAPARHGVK